MRAKTLLIAGVVALCGTLSVSVLATRADQPRSLGCERLRLVALNAFTVTNPDYAVDSGASDDEQDCGPAPGIVKVQVRARMAMDDPPGWSYDIHQESSSALSVPLVKPWRMTGILAEIDQQDPVYDEYGDAVSYLHKAGGDSVLKSSAVQVVVFLKKPVPESSATRIWRNPEVVFLSGARGGKPLAWEPSIWCRFRGFDTCASKGSAEPLTTEFREWVSLLKPEDAPALTGFGLSLNELRDHAAKGLIHGFVARNLPGTLEKLVTDPQILAAYITDIRPPR